MTPTQLEQRRKLWVSATNPNDRAAIAECLFKHRYRSEDEAVVRAYLNEERYGTKAEPYRCRHCKSWHLRTTKRNG